MPSSLTLDNNKKVTKLISTRISPEKIKPFDTNLEPIMVNLSNCRVIVNFNNSVLVQKKFFFIAQLLHFKFIHSP